MTDFSKVCNILGKLYSDFKEDEEFKDFIDFNDLGLPFAYFASERLCEVSDDGARYTMDTWALFFAVIHLKVLGDWSPFSITYRKPKLKWLRLDQLWKLRGHVRRWHAGRLRRFLPKNGLLSPRVAG